jgi:hypothetical protein
MSINSNLKTLIINREQELLLKQGFDGIYADSFKPKRIQYESLLKYFKIFEEKIIDNNYSTTVFYGIIKYKVVICAHGDYFAKRYNIINNNTFCILLANYIREKAGFTYCDILTGSLKDDKCDCDCENIDHFKFIIEFIL